MRFCVMFGVSAGFAQLFDAESEEHARAAAKSWIGKQCLQDLQEAYVTSVEALESLSPEVTT